MCVHVLRTCPANISESIYMEETYTYMLYIPDSAVVALISAKGPRSTVIAATLNVYCVKASSPSTVIEVATEESLKTVTAEGFDGW